MDEEEKFMNILRENWLQLRHQETQRTWTANIFIAIVVGASAYIGTTGLDEIPTFIPLIFLTISVICLLVTLKVNKVFVETKKSIQNIFKDEKIPLGEEQAWKKYVAMLESTGIWKVLRVRYLYVALYAAAIIGSSIWLFRLDKDVFLITWATLVGIAILIAIIAGIITLCRKKRK
jgi:hypothetical protein